MLSNIIVEQAGISFGENDPDHNEEEISNAHSSIHYEIVWAIRYGIFPLL